MVAECGHITLLPADPRSKCDRDVVAKCDHIVKSPSQEPPTVGFHGTRSLQAANICALNPRLQ